MGPLLAIIAALVLLVLLLRRLRLGRSMILAAVALAFFLGVSPAELGRTLADEWHNKPLSQTTGYLFVSLTALLLFVNVLGQTMKESGVSTRLVPAMQGLFRSRRVALSAIPLMMGMLPTPGGIMLSAPMVRDPGDIIGINRPRLAAINFYFRHLLEAVWPIFPAIPLTQGIFGVSAFTVISHNLVLVLGGLIGGTVFLLMIGIPKRKDEDTSHPHFSRNLIDFLHALWPIALATVLSVAFNIPPAIGILIAIFGFFVLHKIPPGKWAHPFKAALEPDLALLILGALSFKLNLQAAQAIPEVMAFLTRAHVPPTVLVFLIPFIVCFVTGVSMPSAAISFPFLVGIIGTGADAKMGLEALAFAGLICGLFSTPVHLCLALSSSYFETPFSRIVLIMLPAIATIALAGVVMALCFG